MAIITKKYAYYVVNDSDDLDALQDCLLKQSEEIDDAIVDYSMDTKLRLKDLIRVCNCGDIIYTPYLARIAKSLSKLYDIVSLAKSKGVKLVFCDKPSMRFDEDSVNGIFNLAALEWAVKLDFEIRSEYNKAHVAKRADVINRSGHFIIENGPRKGEKCTYVGSQKGHDTSKAREASILAKQDAVIAWREQSMAVKFALRKRAEGWTLQRIVDEIGKLYDDNEPSDPNTPNPYATPNGCKPKCGTISRWLREANPLTQ